IRVAGGTIVPSGDVVPPGWLAPVLVQPAPVHCHQLLSVPRTKMAVFFQRICDPLPPAAWTLLRRITPPAPIVQMPPTLSTICVADGTIVPSGDVVPPGLGTENANVFERLLTLVPPEPTADTPATYVVPATKPANRVLRSTVILFVASGVGFPRPTD